MLPKLRCVTLC